MKLLPFPAPSPRHQTELKEAMQGLEVTTDDDETSYSGEGGETKGKEARTGEKGRAGEEARNGEEATTGEVVEMEEARLMNGSFSLQE